MTKKIRFKTNAKCMGCVSVIRKALSSISPESSWVFDLESEDKTMSYEGAKDLSESDITEIIRLVETAGFKITKLD